MVVGVEERAAAPSLAKPEVVEDMRIELLMLTIKERREMARIVGTEAETHQRAAGPPFLMIAAASTDAAFETMGLWQGRWPYDPATSTAVSSKRGVTAGRAGNPEGQSIISELRQARVSRPTTPQRCC
jgi:hypothetical protein